MPTSYKHTDKTRPNIPAAGMAVKDSDIEKEKEPYAYVPHLTPVLRFDESGGEDPLTNHGEYFSPPTTSIVSQYSGFSFESENWSGFEIGFNFDSGGCRNLLMGFYDAGKLSEIDRNRLFALTATTLRVEKSGHWPAWQWWSEYRHWNGETLTKIAHGEFLKDFEEKVVILKKIGDSFVEGFEE